MKPVSRSVTPYLTVKGATEAIAFYQKAFGAKEEMRMPAQDGKRLMHAHLTINDGQVFLSDEFPEHDASRAPTAANTPPVAVAHASAQPAAVGAGVPRE